MEKSTAKSTAIPSETVVRDLGYLVSCAVNNRVPDKERVATMDVDAILSLALRHKLGAAAAMALESAGCKTKRTTELIYRAVRRASFFESEWDIVRKEMEKQGIWYMPLKGAVLRSYYPKYGMREMADYDILFDPDRQADLKVLMESLGYKTKEYAKTNHDVYQKPPVFNFEMHTALFADVWKTPFFNYYKDIEKRLLGDGMEKHFSKEDMYLYLLAHESKHYDLDGTGLRSLLDIYVYLEKESLNFDYIAAEAEKLGLTEFERKNREASKRLFEGENLSEEDAEMLSYIVSSGAYGSAAHRAENKMRKKKWGKAHYALNRFLVPVSKKNEEYNAYASRYPTFYKHKILLPFLPIYRSVRALRAGRFQHEVKSIRSAEKQDGTKNSESGKNKK